MNRLILCTLILFPFVFSSCGKQIEGTVFDNFGKPLEGAKVEIFNTKFEAKTNSSGKYAIDYAAGEVFIRFTHDNYLKREDGVYISEKQTYPFKDVRLTKIPTEAGFYIASDELSDYIKLKSERNVTTKYIEGKSNGLRKTETLEFYNQNSDSTTVIKLSSLDDVRLYSYLIKKHLLGKVSADGKIGQLGTFIFSAIPTANEGIKLSEKELKNHFILQSFTPEFGVNYVLIYEDGFKNSRKLNPVHNIFRFEKK